MSSQALVSGDEKVTLVTRGDVVTTAKAATEQISVLARLLEQANTGSPGSTDSVFGKCEWMDVEGNARCNSPWSQFQCEQVAGVFTPDARCDD
jgi:hypothetical protein